MALEAHAVAVGLTGPFGSGCTTSAAILEDRLGFRNFRLSSVLEAKWKQVNRGRPFKRADLQALGNRLREESKDPGILARLATDSLDREKKKYDKIAFDGIRNIGEIETLKERFGDRFYLFAIECPASQRWDRVRPKYEALSKRKGDALKLFMEDNERDRHQEVIFGQQVQLCVDRADVLVINDDKVTLHELRGKLLDFVNLVTGVTSRYPRPNEILMNVAYSGSHGSKCLKRQVGAVLVYAAPGDMGEVVGLGFNENPVGTLPCVEEPEYGAKPAHGIPGTCFRDIVRYLSFVQLADRKGRCPNCGAVLKKPENKEPPWRCRSCGIDLEQYFWPERAMSLCTAVHAEVAAILAAGRRARGTTLYTTTYPCFQCAEKITQSGIRNIVFTEPYPDIRAAERLEKIAGIQAVRFEGVRSSRFDEIFSRARPYVSAQRKVLESKREQQAKGT